MPRVTHVLKARKDNSLVKKGEPYYWWKFRFGGKCLSKNYPRRSQLTQSNFYSQLWDLEDEISGCSTPANSDDAETLTDDFAQRIREIGDECQESLDNMPESLTYSPTGELLQERIDGMEGMADEMESVDCSPNSTDEPERDAFDSDAEFETAVDDYASEMEDVASSIQEVQFQG